VLRITLEPAGDPVALERRWRALEAETDPGFFRSWTFLGCLAEERFLGARLLSVAQDGCDVALALLGRSRGRLWLNQTGHAAQDAVFIEHNGLLSSDREPGAISAALAHAARSCGAVVLSGVDDATLDAARQAGFLSDRLSRLAPYVDLRALRDVPYLQTLGAGTRAQIRRSQRLYGPELRLDRAATADQAQRWFGELVKLHQETWSRRDRPGAFADASSRRFHEALIARAWAVGEADLLRVTAGDRVVGLLYTFLRDGRVLSYQSGFDYDPTRPREKPGLVCHALAIQHYADQGARLYDLLAGADRYKLSLAQGRQTLHWATLHRPWSASGLLAKARSGVRRVRTALAKRPRPVSAATPTAQETP
jgi:CelD/BcsL family acetyltransferase involved in cellulose biosynthesis